MPTFDVVTIFPAMIEQALAAGIVGRAIERGTLELSVRDLRDFTADRHRVVDDVPYGGGPGMVLKPEPIFRALEAIGTTNGEKRGTAPFVVLTVGGVVRGGGGEERWVVEVLFTRGLFYLPPYTRRAELDHDGVPDVLLGGNRGKIRKGRKGGALWRPFNRKSPRLNPRHGY